MKVEVYIQEVDTKHAAQLLQEMQIMWTSPEIAPLITKAESQVQDLLLGLILTARETGLVENSAKRLEELKKKITVAFSTGFVLGRESR